MAVTPNSEQQEVIDNLHANAILFAGAGTGKTFTMAHRVKNVLLKNLAKPEEILCVTFTVKACRELQEDIGRIADGEIGIKIKTVHGLCFDLLRERAKEQGKPEPSVYDELDQEDLLCRFVPQKLTYIAHEKFADSLGLTMEKFINLPVVFGTPFGFMRKFEKDGKTAYITGANGILPAEKAESAVNATPANAIVCPACKKRQTAHAENCTHCGYDFKTYLKPVFAQKPRNLRAVISAVKRYSEIYSADYEKTCGLIAKHNPELYGDLFGGDGLKQAIYRNIARITEGYNKILRESNRLDFDDLILDALELLKTADYKRPSFKYVIVDEMQDLSGLEYAVLQKFFKGANVMMCGDIAQTIYEWRGSEPKKILQEFIENYGAKTFMLSKNYRSTSTLTKAGTGFAINADPHIFGKYARKSITAERGDGEPVRLVKLKDERAEAKWIFKYLAKHRKENDCCIIARSNLYIAKLYAGLNEINCALPPQDRIEFFTVDRDFRLYKKPVIKDFLAFIAVLLNPNDCENMHRIAQKYIKGIGPATLYKLGNNSFGSSVSAFVRPETYDCGDNFKPLTEAFERGNIVVYDLETTGLNVYGDQAIQIAGVKIDKNGHEISRFTTLIEPTVPISYGALKTHGYSLEYIREHGGVSAKEAYEKFREFTKGAVLVGHNGSTFDRPIVDRQLAENGLPPLDICCEYDTLTLSRQLCRGLKNYKLATLCEEFGIVNKRAHDALADVYATAEVLTFLIKTYLAPNAGEREKTIVKYRDKFLPFYLSYKNMRELLRQDDLKALAEYICDNFGLKEQYGDPEDLQALENIKEIIINARRSFPTAESALYNILNEASLTGSRLSAASGNKIPIITVHQAKGCEFKTVIVAGADSLNFPNASALKSGNQDEEKRVFYVAISRAKDKLILTCHREQRNGYNRDISPYISLIPSDCLEIYDFSDK